MLIGELLRTPSICSKSIGRQAERKPNKTGQTGTILVFPHGTSEGFWSHNTLPQSRAAVLQQPHWRHAFCAVVPAPTGHCSPGGSKRQEATATHAHHGLRQHHQRRTRTHQPSHKPFGLYYPTRSVQKGLKSLPPSNLLQINKVLILRQIVIFLQLWFILALLLPQS